MTSSLEARSEDLTHFDSTRPQYVPGFEPDFVVPVQFYDLIRRSAFLDGETRLVFAVLEDAVRTYLRVRDSHRRRDRVEFAEVARWFEARTGAVPFSFEYVCEVLELEPGLFRKQLRGRATSRAADQAVAIGRPAPARSKYSLREKVRVVAKLRLKSREPGRRSSPLVRS